MSNDLISRAGVIKLIDKYGYANCHNGEVFKANGRVDKIRQKHVEMPSVGADWIPCSERLPDVPEGGIPSNKNEFEDAIVWDKIKQYIVMNEGATEPTVLYYAGDGWYDCCGHPDHVTVWQPLPEPYIPEPRKEDYG